MVLVAAANARPGELHAQYTVRARGVSLIRTPQRFSYSDEAGLRQCICSCCRGGGLKVSYNSLSKKALRLLFVLVSCLLESKKVRHHGRSGMAYN